MDQGNEKKKPMSSAPYVYDTSGAIAWDKMWNSFCVLAKEGGPPHRGTLLKGKGTSNNNQNEAYQNARAEILRAYALLTPYPVHEPEAGWIEVKLYSPHMARWFTAVINAENVECIQKGTTIRLPINDDFTEAEIKNVVTVLAKAQNYWKYHRSTLSRLIIHIWGKDVEAGLWE